MWQRYTGKWISTVLKLEMLANTKNECIITSIMETNYVLDLFVIRMNSVRHN